MNEIDRRDRGGRVAARESASHIVVMLTLTAMLAVVGFLVAGSIARSATQANGTVSLSKTKLGDGPGELEGPHPVHVQQGQERQELLQRKLREVLAALPSARQGQRPGPA